MAQHTTETRGIVLSLTGFFLIFALQLTAYFLTSFLVLLAESFMAIGEILISTFLLLSLYWSRKPADELYMFGRGRAQNVAALVSGMIIILFLGLETFREAIQKLLHPENQGFQNINLALTVIGIAIFITVIPFVSILRGRKTGASIKAQLAGLIIELVADGATLSGIVLVSTGYLWADALASMTVAITMIFSGLYVFKDNVRYLVGRAPNKDFIDRVEATAKSVKGVLGVHDLRAEYVGPNIVHAGLHIEVARGTPIEEADRIAEEAQRKISRETGCEHCVIHVDPASEETL